ncbi:anti-sigma factor [Actinomadura viridis]|uniref:Regulator of SigK n=1 Tax=Actinomadura viridis TaxID=58110 RepID=A0A931DHJ4_9ACTN|nr:anti-sigma factor [Actinomadura viridis]MBG6087045.1 anti-sigma-K factor RskA [Actinomadura viridis]
MTDDPHALSGAYALDALSDTERRRFERHLAGCPTCDTEVGGLRETAARLALAAARRPPDALRDRVLAEIRHTRQLPPRLPRHLPAPRGAGWLAAAACLVLALVSGVAAVRAHDAAERAEAFNRQMTGVLTAPDARAVTAGGVTIVTSRSQDRALITVSRLESLPSDQVYQMWFMGPDAPRSIGTMKPGAPPPVIAGGLRGARQIGVTVEPGGGSPRPTGAPILTVPLS